MGYNQVEVDPFDRAMTAFLIHCGLYIYNVMLAGLCNASATFNRLMKRVLGFLVGVGVLVYLNDFFIYANTSEHLIDFLSAVLKLLANAGLKYKATTCSLFIERMHYLSQLVSKDGSFPDPA